MTCYPEITWVNQGEIDGDDNRWKGTAKGYEMDVRFQWSGEWKGYWTAILNCIAIQTGSGEHGYLFDTAEAAKEALEIAMHDRIDSRVKEARAVIDTYDKDDTEPLNFNGPTVTEAVQQVREFLQDPVRIPEDSDSPKALTPEQLGEAWTLFSQIISAKYEMDADGDSQLEFAIGDRAQDSLLYLHMPNDPRADIEKSMETVSAASAINHLVAKRICGSLQVEAMEKRQNREWKNQCGDILTACNIPGLLNASLATTLTRWALKGILDTGYNRKDGDAMWEDLGLTAREVHEAYHDREDRHEPFETINEACKMLLTDWDEADTDTKIARLDTRKDADK